MKANVSVAISALRYVQSKQQEHSKEMYENNITYHGCWYR